MTPAPIFEFDLKVTLSLILTVAAMIYTWWKTRDQNTDARFKVVDGRFRDGSERMDRHEARLNSLEQTLRGLPVVKDMHDLQISITALNGKLETMAAVMDGNSKVMNRLEDVVERQENYLMGQKR